MIGNLDRAALLDRFTQNRARSAALFSLVRDALYERPLPRRMPFVFYAGHLPAFSWLTLRRACNLAPIDAELEALFDRGIDPDSDEEAARLQPRAWPDAERVANFTARVDAAIGAHLRAGTLVDPAVPMLVDGQALFALLEHEEMHQETLCYLLACLDAAKKNLGETRVRATPDVPRANAVRHIPAGRATLGMPANADFAWDNERAEISVDVPAFAVRALPVTNREYAAYVARGGAVPAHWRREGGTWTLRTALNEVPLPPEWPACVSPQAATEYARDHGARLMSEAEYHRAAFGRPDGGENAYPWGDVAPTPARGNFDFQNLHPENVGARPAGRSAFGVDELCGNGWEITATPFAPFPGFAPLASYPQYSADFFDGRHYVVKGASCVTARPLLRRSLRNWFYRDYPYAFLKFRLAFDA